MPEVGQLMDFVLLVLSASGLAALAVTVCAARAWTTLKLSLWHLFIWLTIGLAAASLAVWICWDYNQIAGTDKTPAHVAQISAAVFAGPLVGPVANPGAGEIDFARQKTAILLVIMLLGTSPFMVVRQIVPTWVAVIAWLTFTFVSVVWFLGAILSLILFLS